MVLADQIAHCADALRAAHPLVHCMTNYVTITDCANAALAVGASPIMADDPGEAAEITAHAGALALNIGKLDPRTLDGMVLAGRAANHLGLPVVFDPVGAGVSQMRGAAAARILREVRIAIVRCNRSEAAFLAGLAGSSQGVDADGAVSQDDSAALALTVAQQYDCVTALTGATDLLSDGKQLVQLHNGHPMLSRVTGMGCAATVLCASYAAICPDAPLIAAATGISAMSVAGELAYAAAGARGTGSFHVAVIDALSRLNSKTLRQRLQIEVANV